MRGGREGDGEAGFHVGTSKEGVDVTILGREHVDARDYWDGNWLRTSVDVRAGAFRGQFDASLRADELEAFLDELRTLHPGAPGTAQFRSIEQWIDFDVSLDRLGRLTVAGTAKDHAIGNTLSFQLPELDQTFLPPLISQLERTLDQFPLVGSPDAQR